MAPHQLAALDAWRASQANPPSRPEAMRLLVAAAIAARL